MDNLKIINKLSQKTNISIEEAKEALEKTNYDILDAVIYLEESGKIQKPQSSAYYTKKQKIKIENEPNENYKKEEETSKLEGIFENICRWIDIYNHIMLEIKRKNKVFLKLPITLVIILLIFTMGISIPLIIIGLIFDIEFSIKSNKINADKINELLKKLSIKTKQLKKKIQEKHNNGNHTNHRR